MLEDVEEAIAENDFETALECVLDTWRKNRYAVLADLVDAIARHLPAPKPLPRDQKEFHAEWLRRAGDKTKPLDSLILQSLARSVPMPQRYYWAQGTGAVRYAAWSARLELLVDRPHDPRIALAAFSVLDKSPFTVGWDVDAFTVYGPLLTILEHTDDERVIPLIERLSQLPTATRQTVRRYYKTSLPPTKEKLERSQSIRPPIPPVLQEKAESLIHQLGGAITSSSLFSSGSHEEEEASLLEMVIESPDDDAARAVLGDFWLERNDPRGELINLQLKEARGEATPQDQKAIRALLRAHEKTWLGELALVTKRRVFRRGFLDELELQQNSAADPEVWEATTKSPSLATVRVLRKGKANEQHYRSFLFSPALKSLRTISLPRKAMLEDALRRPDPWPVSEMALTFAPDRTELETLSEVKAKTFPHLTKLTLGVKPGRVRKVIELASKKLASVDLSCIAVTPVSWYTEDTSELAEWLRSIAGKLSHVPAIEIVFFVGLREDRLIATRAPKKEKKGGAGERALALDFVGESLYFIDPMLKALEPFEVAHLRLRVHPEEDDRVTPQADLRLRALVERFGGKDVVDLDEAWSRAHAAS